MTAAPFPLRAFLPSLSLSLAVDSPRVTKGATATLRQRASSIRFRDANGELVSYFTTYSRGRPLSRYTLAIPPARPGTRRGRSTTVTTRRANRGTASGTRAGCRFSAAPDAREVHRRARRAPLSRSVPPSRGGGARPSRARDRIKMKPGSSGESECESRVIVISLHGSLFIYESLLAEIHFIYSR